MLLSNAKTWTIVLILYILPKCTFSVAIGNRELTPKTLFEALVVKFPQVENTTLRETLSEIFISSCSNWTAIENAKPIILDKDYVPCRLLYESIDSFLTSVGKQYVLSKSFVDTIMSSKHSLQDICIGNKSFSSHFSALSTKKDLSAYLEETICLFSCVDTLKSFINQSIDTCNVAYFFATFDVPKFLADSESSLKKSNYQTKEENKDPLLKVSEDQATAPKVESKVGDDNPLSVVSQAEFQKSKQKYTNKKSLGHIKDEQQPLTDKANEKSTQGESVNGVFANKSQDNKLSIDEGKIENKHGITEASVENVAVISSIKPEIKPIGKTEVLQDEKSLNSPAKDLSNADKTAVESDNNNNRENQGDISLDNDNEKDEADPGTIGDESETAKQEENFQPIHSQQIEPKKLPSKKPKPNTLDADEPASSVNIVDDDMDGDSYFFSYFTVLMCLVIVGYVGYHNRQKVLALLLEGKRGKRNGRNVRRPNSANYHKLDSNLEEAMSSSCTKNTSNVIY